MGNNVYFYEVSPEEQGMGLLSFLRSRIRENVSAKAIKKAIDGKRCRINGRVELFASYTLACGDKIECEIVFENVSRQDTKHVVILYEDSDLLICNKPAGIVSEPRFFPFPPVHRLDKETSGALILAKTQAFEKQMIRLFQKREVGKEYLALVDGAVKEPAGKIDNFLDKKFTYEGQTVWASARTGEGMRAITFWTRLCNGKDAALLQCMPVTGRTHQLRVHLSEMGHPLLGDFQYGKKFVCTYRAPRHLLHALKISFIHPVSKREISVTAPLPDDFREALTSLDMVTPQFEGP